MLIVQYPILSTWTVQPIITPQNAFWIPFEDAKIEFTETSGGTFPTDAFIRVLWGDHPSTYTIPFMDTSGSNKPILQHKYKKGGNYNITAYIFNSVSGITVSCQVM
ncbi:hypothetical protein SK128_015828 [Halocaridina rubra]|uniref:PKD domain-containing protein n=1 Tax=Halocaridina rubra TaxID=373956 RepID=A0AAN9A541_HALRR